MCRHLTILTHAGACRAVAQCEHGTLHMTWDIATVRLRQRDFVTVAEFLERWGTDTETLSKFEGWCSLVRDSHGAARVWIGQVGLAIAAADMATFVALIVEAGDMLHTAAAHPSTVPQTVWHCPVLMTDVGTLGQN